MREFIKRLIVDESVDAETKIQMLIKYREMWSNKMATSIQSKRAINEQPDILNIIDKAIETVGYKVKV